MAVHKAGEQYLRDVLLKDGRHVRIAPIQLISPYVQDARIRHGIYRLYTEDPDQALQVLDMVEKDATVSASVSYLARNSAGSSWRIESRKKETRDAADYVEDALHMIPDFTRARRNLMRAVVRGLQLLHITWERRWVKLGDDKIARPWWMITHLQEVDKRKLRLWRQPGRRDIAYWSIWEPGLDMYVVVENRKNRPDAMIAEQDFVWHYADEIEVAAGYGHGLGDQLFELVYIKNKLLQYRAELAEMWARPLWIYKMDVEKGVLDDATMGSLFSSPSARATKLMENVRKMRARHSIAIPNHDELEIVEQGAEAAHVIDQYIFYLDQQMRILLLASNHGTALMGQGAKSSSGYSAEKIHQDATLGEIEYHKDRLEETLSRGLIEQWVERNRWNLHAAGAKLPQAGDLRMRLHHKKPTEYGDLVLRLRSAAEWGLALPEGAVYELLDFPQPIDGEPTIKALDAEQTPHAFGAGSEGGTTTGIKPPRGSASGGVGGGGDSDRDTAGRFAPNPSGAVRKRHEFALDDKRAVVEFALDDLEVPHGTR